MRIKMALTRLEPVGDEAAQAAEQAGVALLLAKDLPAFPDLEVTALHDELSGTRCGRVRLAQPGDLIIHAETGRAWVTPQAVRVEASGTTVVRLRPDPTARAQPVHLPRLAWWLWEAMQSRRALWPEHPARLLGDCLELPWPPRSLDEQRREVKAIHDLRRRGRRLQAGLEQLTQRHSAIILQLARG